MGLGFFFYYTVTSRRSREVCSYSIIERVHQVIKGLLAKQKMGEIGLSPQERNWKVLYVLNFLQLAGNADNPPMVIHSSALSNDLSTVKTTGIKVMYKDLNTGQWTGPAEVQVTSRGYMCVVTDSGPKWVLARWVKPWKSSATVNGRNTTTDDPGDKGDNKS